MKSETRSPRSDPLRRRDCAARGNPKPEDRKHPLQSPVSLRFLHRAAGVHFGLRISAFLRASGIRISDFTFKICMGFQCSYCAEWLMVVQAGKHEVQAKISRK